MDQTPGCLRVEFHARVVGDVDPDVHVRGAAVVPDERRAFEPPDVPDAVFADVLLGEVGEVAGVEAALLFEALERFVAVGLTVGLDQIAPALARGSHAGRGRGR